MRAILALLAVAAVLLGIAAMHAPMAADAFAEAGHAHAYTHTHADTHTHAHADDYATDTAGVSAGAVALLSGGPLMRATFEAGDGECSGMCAVDCMMAGAACMLGIAAAAATGLLLLARPAIENYAVPTAFRALSMTARRLATPRPPSLFVLSICRT